MIDQPRLPMWLPPSRCNWPSPSAHGRVIDKANAMVFESRCVLPAGHDATRHRYGWVEIADESMRTIDPAPYL